MLERARGKDDLAFVSKANMIYKSIESAEREQDCVTALFGKFPVQHQQIFLDVFEIEDLSFERLVVYYQRKGKQDNFISIANMQTGVAHAVSVANRRTEDVKNRGVNMMRAVGRRVMGGGRERNPTKCNVCGRLGHIASNCYMAKPCTKCGRYGHSPANFWGENP